MARTKLPVEALKFFQRAGRRGAKVRLEKLTPQKRAEVARTTAKVRWAKRKKLHDAIQLSRLKKQSMAQNQFTPFYPKMKRT
jgi:hypothetical protein